MVSGIYIYIYVLYISNIMYIYICISYNIYNIIYIYYIPSYTHIICIYDSTVGKQLAPVLDKNKSSHDQIPSRQGLRSAFARVWPARRPLRAGSMGLGRARNPPATSTQQSLHEDSCFVR